MDAPHEGVAFERFTPDGPVALLPEGDHYGLIWTMSPEQGERTMALSDDEFLAQLARHFGARVAGYRSVRERKTFPLALEYARPATAARCVLIGNAAQTLHPIAGQGFNLGVRDAFVLAQAIIEGGRDALGDRAMVAGYAARRRVDRYAGIAFTHGLTQTLRARLAAAALAARRGADAARCDPAREARVHSRDAVRIVLNTRSLHAANAPRRAACARATPPPPLPDFCAAAHLDAHRKPL